MVFVNGVQIRQQWRAHRPAALAPLLNNPGRDTKTVAIDVMQHKAGGRRPSPRSRSRNIVTRRR